MRRLFLLFFALIAINATAQNYFVSGTVRASENMAATVSLLQAADSATVKTTLTAKEGIFSFSNINPGKYFVAITAAGYQKLYSALFTINNESVHLAPLQLQPLARTLAAVTVSSKRP